MPFNKILIPLVIMLALLLPLRICGPFKPDSGSGPLTKKAVPVTQNEPVTPTTSPKEPSSVSINSPYKIAFLSGKDHKVTQNILNQAQYTYELYIMNADGSNLKQLSSGEGYSSKGPALWSPDASKIAVLNDVLSLDGREQWKIRAEASSWSPDSRKIAFADNTGIYTSTPDGGNEKLLSNNKYDGGATIRSALRDDYGAQPAWSPDGSKIVFSSSRFGSSSNLCMVDADGGIQVRLTYINCTRAVWSPNSSTIAFIGGYPEALYIINLKGLNNDPVEICSGLDFSDDLVWSPDSRKIAFSGSTTVKFAQNKEFAIYAVDAVAAAYKYQLTPKLGNNFNPDWSPDGKLIIYEGGDGIYIMNADGSNNTRITSHASDCYPRWAPQ